MKNHTQFFCGPAICNIADIKKPFSLIFQTSNEKKKFNKYSLSWFFYFLYLDCSLN